MFRRQSMHACSTEVCFCLWMYERIRPIIYSKPTPTTPLLQPSGFGLNFQQKGLQTLLERVYRGSVDEVVVRHKDRLCRYGLDTSPLVPRAE